MRLALAVLLSGVVPGLAAAAPGDVGGPPMIVEGIVTSTSAKWVGEGAGDRILTEARVQTPTGEVVVTQHGGHADGLTMRKFPGPELLAPGMRVAVNARRADDLSGRTHVVVETVRVLAYPTGYVHSGPTLAGRSLYWESGCTFLTVNEAGTKAIPGDTEFELVEEAVAAWNDGIASCSYMQIKITGREDREVGRDKVNTLVFRDASWCRPAKKNEPPDCHQESAAGITTAVYVDDATSDRDGAIVDADIELNGYHFAISHDGNTLGDATQCKADLLNTLTHELGHLLGLEHPCLARGDEPRVDGNGAAVPTCDLASSAAITEATMYNYQDCGETKKASVEADDIAGVCALYPTAEDPGTCEAVGDGGGCCNAGHGPSAPALLIVGLGAVLGFRRRRR